MTCLFYVRTRYQIFNSIERLSRRLDIVNVEKELLNATLLVLEIR